MSELHDIRMPEDQQEGTVSTVSSWLKQPGDAVKANEPLVELETDKVNVEVAAPADGILAEILVPAGEQAEPGCLLGRIGTGIRDLELAPLT